ncbi:hypothetical protein BV898_02026 [Hypsibius exemplaris]|uniref:Uncharacterized protein n=1 Tax=Hypsibius exemplaris TaxID=2072580 RepID=A0A1W0X9T1_HYPEX|nr:hypothetical protein BV898_02026 [Hypsibius exemplaris]
MPGDMLSRPPDEPFGKKKDSLLDLFQLDGLGSNTVGLWFGRKNSASRCLWVFFRKISHVSIVHGATDSSEDSILSALLILPACIFFSTAFCNLSSEPFAATDVVFLDIARNLLVLLRLLLMVVASLQLDGLSGLEKTRKGKVNRWPQLYVVLELQIWSGDGVAGCKRQPLEEAVRLAKEM